MSRVKKGVLKFAFYVFSISHVYPYYIRVLGNIDGDGEKIIHREIIAVITGATCRSV